MIDFLGRIERRLEKSKRFGPQVSVSVNVKDLEELVYHFKKLENEDRKRWEESQREAGNAES